MFVCVFVTRDAGIDSSPHKPAEDKADWKMDECYYIIFCHGLQYTNNISQRR